ncbi:hypothetical protein DFH08DRAFT_820521 [Mycena albidolilacea]|uniref:Uncharacterized protein n=1 Tax=Mycena albidolilacea TaxID=1033008 RepID=A0AAD6ZDB0_9AGAR|nr:hypothetical protein DFH08DRAFT_820521 [Mycena albidolilacea]
MVGIFAIAGPCEIQRLPLLSCLNKEFPRLGSRARVVTIDDEVKEYMQSVTFGMADVIFNVFLGNDERHENSIVLIQLAEVYGVWRGSVDSDELEDSKEYLQRNCTLAEVTIRESFDRGMNIGVAVEVNSHDEIRPMRYIGKLRYTFNDSRAAGPGLVLPCTCSGLHLGQSGRGAESKPEWRSVKCLQTAVILLVIWPQALEIPGWRPNHVLASAGAMIIARVQLSTHQIGG